MMSTGLILNVKKLERTPNIYKKNDLKKKIFYKLNINLKLNKEM